jgi:hypothetical protein
MLDWLQTVWDIFKTIAPWLTGGVAGAALGYALNQRNARKKLPRLLMRTDRVDYSIPSRDQTLQDLRVSYEGKSYENLLLFQLDIENVSSRSITSSPFLVKLKPLVSLPDIVSLPNFQIIDKSSVVKPVNRDTKWESMGQEPGVYIWDAEELKPGDSAQLRLLITPALNVECTFRGDDDVEVISSERESAASFESDLRNVIAWIAVFILINAIPFLGDVFRAFFLFVSIPYIVRYVQRWRALIAGSRNATTGSPPIVISDTSAQDAQEKINTIVQYSLAFYLFDHLYHLYHDNEYIYHKNENFAHDLRFLREHGYLEDFHIGPLQDGENLIGKARLTPLGKLLVELREQGGKLQAGSTT